MSSMAFTLTLRSQNVNIIALNNTKSLKKTFFSFINFFYCCSMKVKGQTYAHYVYKNCVDACRFFGHSILSSKK